MAVVVVLACFVGGDCCRSCGQIFCADCSEFWAALPDERLYQPVRLCGPCYHNVTTNTQVSVYCVMGINVWHVLRNV